MEYTLETGFYKVIIDEKFTIAEFTENGNWLYIDEFTSGEPETIGNKISEHLDTADTTKANLNIQRVSSLFCKTECNFNKDNICINEKLYNECIHITK